MRRLWDPQIDLKGDRIAQNDAPSFFETKLSI